MDFKRLLKNRLVVLSALGITAMVLLFLDGSLMQCPEHYTQAQVDATGCTIGANIGLGLIFLVLIGLAILWVSMYILAFRSLKQLFKVTSKPKKSNSKKRR